MERNSLIFWILFIALQLCVSQSAARPNDNATFQRFENIDEVYGILQTMASAITEQNTGNITSLADDLLGRWHIFTNHHTTVFANEIIPPEEITSLIDEIEEQLGGVVELLATGNFEDALGAIESVEETLHVLKERSAIPVLLDFTGSTCKACKIMKPRLEELAPEYAERVRIVFVNVNSQKSLTKAYKIILIPTLVFITRNGEEAARHVGEMEASTIRLKLNELLEEE